MHRRDLLRYGLSLGAGALSGCTDATLEAAEHAPPPAESLPYREIDLPVPQRLSVAADAIAVASDATVEDADALVDHLVDAGVAVTGFTTTVEAEEPTHQLDYAVTDLHDVGHMQRLGLVAGGYAALVRGGNGGDWLHAAILDPSGSRYGEFEIARQWAERYNDGASTARRYADEISHTLVSA